MPRYGQEEIPHAQTEVVLNSHENYSQLSVEPNDFSDIAADVPVWAEDQEFTDKPVVSMLGTGYVPELDAPEPLPGRSKIRDRVRSSIGAKAPTNVDVVRAEHRTDVDVEVTDFEIEEADNNTVQQSLSKVPETVLYDWSNDEPVAAKANWPAPSIMPVHQLPPQPTLEEINRSIANFSAQRQTGTETAAISVPVKRYEMTITPNTDSQATPLDESDPLTRRQILAPIIGASHAFRHTLQKVDYDPAIKAGRQHLVAPNTSKRKFGIGALFLAGGILLGGSSAERNVDAGFSAATDKTIVPNFIDQEPATTSTVQIFTTSTTPKLVIAVPVESFPANPPTTTIVVAETSTTVEPTTVAETTVNEPPATEAPTTLPPETLPPETAPVETAVGTTTPTTAAHTKADLYSAVSCSDSKAKIVTGGFVSYLVQYLQIHCDSTIALWKIQKYNPTVELNNVPVGEVINIKPVS